MRVLPDVVTRRSRHAHLMKKEIEIVLRATGIGLMLLGAMMLVAGISSALPFALITLGIALTVIVATRRQPAH